MIGVLWALMYDYEHLRYYTLLWLSLLLILYTKMKDDDISTIIDDGVCA